MLGANEHCKPIRSYQFIFDLVTRWYDFRGTNVKFVGVKDLCDYYEKVTGKKSNNVHVYDLSLKFMDDHRNSHYIFDEVPFTKTNGKNNFMFITLTSFYYFLSTKNCYDTCSEILNFQLL